ncbi:hypothetical protein [Falsiroseomonas sp. CW058]|uniref:hypothetical protein n=1 Tax=Falsiroseomonas sp. CW058 TaxID=3388664 RepID=UPI003D320FD3
MDAAPEGHAAPRRRMDMRDLAAATPFGLLAGATLLLLALQAAPRAGEPVGFLFAPGLGPEEALPRLLATPDWAPLALRRIGPLTMLVAAPLAPPAGAAAPARPAGAWLALAAGRRFGCAPAPNPSRNPAPQPE